MEERFSPRDQKGPRPGILGGRCGWSGEEKEKAVRLGRWLEWKLYGAL